MNIIHIIEDALRGSIQISGLVVVMMMLIEVFNIRSHGHLLERMKDNRIGQILLASFLGIIPGCMGGFAAVSLYSHGLLSFGALVAMLVASSGDEAFVMLAMFPKRSAWLFLALFVIAVIIGLLTDLLRDEHVVCNSMTFHAEDELSGQGNGKQEHSHHHSRHFGWKRIVMFTSVLLFIAALLSGVLSHDDVSHAGDGINIDLLSEDWMNWLFALCGVCVLGVLLFGGDHFVEEHLWHHIVEHHLPGIIMWTFSVLFAMGFLLGYFDVNEWISDNTALMILLAAVIGLIPESGPSLIFVTLYATGIVPLPVILASCISQDGHSSLPLLAESRSAFVKAKLINVAAALVVGYICWFVV